MNAKTKAHGLRPYTMVQYSAGWAAGARTRPEEDGQINRLHADGFLNLRLLVCSAMSVFWGGGIIDVRLIENS